MAELVVLLPRAAASKIVQDRKGNFLDYLCYPSRYSVSTLLYFYLTTVASDGTSARRVEWKSGFAGYLPQMDCCGLDPDRIV